MSGIASFRTTTEGVDLSVEIRSCIGGQQYAQRILDATSCAPDVMQAPVWSGGRGSSMPPIFCIGVGTVDGATSYARLTKRNDAWTLGGAADSELTGRVLVVLDADSGEPLACGAITRTPDVVRTPIPPAEQPPRLETRAALGGLCFGRQFAGSGAGCPDARGVYECTNVHCDLGGCLETCEAYLSCVDSQADVCAATACELTAECAQCQSDLMTCALGFCAEHLACAPAITPDGPCQQLAMCCVLQGDHADSCLGVLTPLIGASRRWPTESPAALAPKTRNVRADSALQPTCSVRATRATTAPAAVMPTGTAARAVCARGRKALPILAIACKRALRTPIARVKATAAGRWGTASA